MALHRSQRKGVKDFWHLLQKMQGLIDGGATPNAAATLVATKHWRETPKSYDTCLAWLKVNQRRYRDQLNPWLVEVERIRVAEEAWLNTLSPKDRAFHERELAHLDGMRESQRLYYVEHPEELAKKVAEEY